MDEIVRQLQDRARTQTDFSPDNALASSRIGNIRSRIDAITADPSVAHGWQLVHETINRDDHNAMFNPYQTGAPHNQQKVYLSPTTAAGVMETALLRLNEEERYEIEPCKSDQACSRPIAEKYDRKRCDVFQEATNSWRRSALLVDGAVAEVWDPTFKLMTGLAANISDPLHYELVRLSLENHADRLLDHRLLSVAISPGPYGTAIKAPTGRSNAVTVHLPKLGRSTLPRPTRGPVISADRTR
ncbi:hypothetical protein ACFSC4_16180 [Deinococcus malanensis]|uniref:hypothetical protein n=1 Tax=Deinococcus malanensis TaxID=1706855 RepID=UPI00362D91BA